jgi:hypothetical protein
MPHRGSASIPDLPALGLRIGAFADHQKVTIHEERQLPDSSPSWPEPPLNGAIGTQDSQCANSVSMAESTTLPGTSCSWKRSASRMKSVAPGLLMLMATDLPGLAFRAHMSPGQVVARAPNCRFRVGGFGRRTTP